MTRILDGVKAGDPVIVTSYEDWRNTRRKIREVDYVDRVFKHVLQTKGGLVGVEIGTGRALKHYGLVTVAGATESDVAEVLREIEERKRDDEAEKMRRDAERAADKRYGELRGEVSRILSMRVPEDVLIRALMVLRGDDRENVPAVLLTDADLVRSIDGLGDCGLVQKLRAVESAVLAANGKAVAR